MYPLTPLQRHLIQVNQEKARMRIEDKLSGWFTFTLIAFGGAYFLGHILVKILGV